MRRGSSQQKLHLYVIFTAVSSQSHTQDIVWWSSCCYCFFVSFLIVSFEKVTWFQIQTKTHERQINILLGNDETSWVTHEWNTVCILPETLIKSSIHRSQRFNGRNGISNLPATLAALHCVTVVECEQIKGWLPFFPPILYPHKWVENEKTTKISFPLLCGGFRKMWHSVKEWIRVGP